MTDEQKELIKSSFEKIKPMSETVAVLFYARLFELDSRLRHLFKSNMNEQGRKLMGMIGLAVSGLDHLEKVVLVVRSLGERHAGYGIEERDYETVGNALLWTLEQVLGSAFEVETRKAWTIVYNLLAETMKDASRPSPAIINVAAALDSAVSAF